jgi:peptide/nickel transport system substrate-binding protein
MALAQRLLAEQAPWLTLARTQLTVFATQRVDGVRAHGLYGIGIYRGLDLRVVR